MRLVKWVIGVVLVLAVVITGGTFVYIHFIEGDAPKPLALTEETTAASQTTNSRSSDSSSSTDSVAGTWKVQTNGTTVGYRVKEVLFGQDNTAVGRTDAVTGSVVISGTTVKTASFTTDMTKVSSDRSQRDNQFQGRIMDTSKFPTSTFTLTSPISIAPVPAEGKVASYKATGKLTMHGTTKAVTFTLSAQRTSSNLNVQGAIPVKFSDWNIPNPTFGPVSTQDHGTMEFLIVFTKS